MVKLAGSTRARDLGQFVRGIALFFVIFGKLSGLLAAVKSARTEVTQQQR